MKNRTSVYQTLEYFKAMEAANEKIIKISEGFFGVERTIKLPLLGRKKILEARGTPSGEDIKPFMDKSRDFFYGTIAPTVVNFKEESFVNYKKVTNYTMLIDLKRSEEEIWQSLEKKSARWGVKTAEKNKLSFEEASEKDLDVFYSLYDNTARDGGFKPESREFIKTLMNSKISKLFVIKKESKIVAGGMILIDFNNKYSVLDLTSSSKEGLELQAMPFLYWNLIKYSKNIGMNHFDLGGYDREAREGDKTYNINKFKERFGGEVVEQPIYATDWKYLFMRKILRKFRRLRNLYEKG